MPWADMNPLLFWSVAIPVLFGAFYAMDALLHWWGRNRWH